MCAKDPFPVAVHKGKTVSFGKSGITIGEPVWDKWVVQKLIYEPHNEILLYFIDGEKKSEFVIGELPFGSGNKLQLRIYLQGWWLHHSIEIDNVEVCQY